MPYLRLTTRRQILLTVLTLTLFLAVFLALNAGLVKEGIGYLVKRVKRIKGTIVSLPVDEQFNYSLLLSFIIALTPITIIVYFNSRYIKGVEKYIPVFLREIADSIRSGLSLVESLSAASLRGFGNLGAEMRKVMARVYLGMPLKDSIGKMVERLPSVKLKRFASILVVAEESGGRVVSVIETAAKVFSILSAFEREKRSRVKPYILVVYVAQFLTIFIGFLLIEVFFKPLARMSGKTTFIKAVDVDIYQSLLFYLSFIEAVFGGIVAGKMSEGTVKAGLTHMLLLLILVYVSFALLFPMLRGFTEIIFLQFQAP